MKSIALTTASPGTFGYTAGQTLYNEMLAHEILTVMHALAGEGYEITFEEDSDLDAAWTNQATTLNQQSSLLDALEDKEELGGEWTARLSSAKAQIVTLLSLDQTKENFAAREMTIGIIESLFNSIATSLTSGDIGADTDLLDILKAAFLEETVPGSGVYTTTTLAEIKDIKEQGEDMLQAIQDLKYNDMILEIPATPRPIRVHLVSKTIQQ